MPRVLAVPAVRSRKWEGKERGSSKLLRKIRTGRESGAPKAMGKDTTDRWWEEMSLYFCCGYLPHNKGSFTPEDAEPKCTTEVPPSVNPTCNKHMMGLLTSSDPRPFSAPGVCMHIGTQMHFFSDLPHLGTETPSPSPCRVPSLSFDRILESRGQSTWARSFRILACTVVYTPLWYILLTCFYTGARLSGTETKRQKRTFSKDIMSVYLVKQKLKTTFCAQMIFRTPRTWHKITIPTYNKCVCMCVSWHSNYFNN